MPFKKSQMQGAKKMHASVRNVVRQGVRPRPTESYLSRTSQVVPREHNAV